VGGVFAALAAIFGDLQFFGSVGAVSFRDISKEIADGAFETSELAWTFFSHMFYSWYCTREREF